MRLERSEDEIKFIREFWETWNTLNQIVRKLSPPRRKRVTNYTQAKHSRRRRQ